MAGTIILQIVPVHKGTAHTLKNRFQRSRTRPNQKMNVISHEAIGMYFKMINGFVMRKKMDICKIILFLIKNLLPVYPAQYNMIDSS
jgi:hypothetical protein